MAANSLELITRDVLGEAERRGGVTDAALATALGVAVGTADGSGLLPVPLVTVGIPSGILSAAVQAGIAAGNINMSTTGMWIFMLRGLGFLDTQLCFPLVQMDANVAPSEN